MLLVELCAEFRNESGSTALGDVKVKSIQPVCDIAHFFFRLLAAGAPNYFPNSFSGPKDVPSAAIAPFNVSKDFIWNPGL